MRTAVRLLAAALALTSTGVAAEEVPIGTHGATLQLDEGWERRILADGAGPDQFANGTDVFTVVVEQEALFERRADFENALLTRLSGLKNKLDDPDVEPAMRYEHRDGVGHGSRRLSGAIGGLRVAYQLDLLSRDGLSYMLLTWGTATQTLELQAAATRLAEGLRFPPPESDWGRRAVASPHAFHFGEWTFELLFRDSVFSAATTEGERRSVAAPQGEVALHLFLDQLELDLEPALDRIIEIVGADSELEELERDDVVHPAGPGRQVLLRSTAPGNRFDVAVAMIEIEPHRFADLRLLSLGPVGHRQALWERLLASFKAIPPRQVDAFPVVEATGDEEAAALGEEARALLAASRLLGTAAAWWTRMVRAGDGRVLALEPRRIVALAAEGDPAVLYASDDPLNGWLAERRGEVLFGDAQGQVSAVRDGKLEPLDLQATRVVGTDDGWLLVRDAEAPSVLGFGQLPSLAPSRLVLRRPSGEEREVAALDERDVQQLAAAASGKRALVAATRRAPLEPAAEEATVELLEIDLEDGSRRSRGRWRTVTAVAAAEEDGWLVSGRPAAGTTGVYRLPATGGGEELLVSGPVTGLALDGEGLTLATDRCLDAAGQAARRCVYQTPPAAVRAHGRAFLPFDAATLDRIAAAAAADGGLPQLATAAEIAAFVAAADAASERLVGSPLPRSRAAIDRLLADLAGEATLSDRALVTLAALVTRTLLDDGAEWVASGRTLASARPTGEGWEGESVLAVALDPLQVVFSTLYHEDGWWHPLAALDERIAGRTLLLGADPQTLRDALRRDRLPELAEVVDEDRGERLERLLEEHRGNRFLRTRVYERLAAGGRSDTLARLASRFAAAQPPHADDLRAWLAARWSLGPSADELPGLIDDLRHAITQAPAEATLYLLLGATYEAAVIDDRDAYALACYRKAAEVASWGEVADAARQAISRLTEERDP